MRVAAAKHVVQRAFHSVQSVASESETQSSSPPKSACSMVMVRLRLVLAFHLRLHQAQQI